MHSQRGLKFKAMTAQKVHTKQLFLPGWGIFVKHLCMQNLYTYMLAKRNNITWHVRQTYAYTCTHALAATCAGRYIYMHAHVYTHYML